MNLYTVTFKASNSANLKTCRIVARNVTGAIDGAKAFIRKEYYGDVREIVTVETVFSIDRVEK